MSKRSKHQKVAQSTTYEFECLDDDHEPGCRCGKGRTDSTTYHTNEQDNGSAVRYSMGLPPYSPVDYSPLTNEDFVPTQVCTRREHELLRGRISNQRRELRHLNRAYRRRENENVRRITVLKEQVRLARKVIEQRNQKIEDQQREIDELKRILAIAENGGRRRRGARWAGK